jgi:hypothetical protein
MKRLGLARLARSAKPLRPNPEWRRPFDGIERCQKLGIGAMKENHTVIDRLALDPSGGAPATDTPGFIQHDRIHVGFSEPVGARKPGNARSHNDDIDVQEYPRSKKSRDSIALFAS